MGGVYRVAARPGRRDEERLDRSIRMQAQLDPQVAGGKVHNIAAAVQSHYGSVDFVGAAMKPETPCLIASITKLYTMAVTTRLVGNRRPDLSTPITKYLPASLTRAVHAYKGTDYSDRITVEQLVAMTSGLPDYEGDKPRGGFTLRTRSWLTGLSGAGRVI
jgi:D-alanyl-D-alanine carboxypeptidase